MAKKRQDPQLPPHDRAAEQALLGAIMLKSDVVDDLIEFNLTPEDFYFSAHNYVYGSMLDLFNNGINPDVDMVARELSAKGQIEKMGGVAYLSELLDSVATTANTVYHAQVIKDKATLRELISIGRDVEIKALDPFSKANEVLELAENKILSIRENGFDRKGLAPIDAAMVKETLKAIEQRSKSNRSVTGVPTGFVDLDRLTGGWQSSDLIVLAARPSMGKTALGLNFAVTAAISGERIGYNHGQEYPVAFFSMEMSTEQLRDRLFALLAKVDSTRIRSGEGLTSDDFTRLTIAGSKISQADIYIDDSPALSSIKIRAKARKLYNRLARKNKRLALIIVDYLQLGEGIGKTSEEQISELSQHLKSLAKELRVPVIALSQLNRELEKRTDKRPILADLRGSGAIEQNADIVAFIYREVVYNPKADPSKAELLVRKHRNGPTGVVNMVVDLKYNLFQNAERW